MTSMLICKAALQFVSEGESASMETSRGEVDRMSVEMMSMARQDARLCDKQSGARRVSLWIARLEFEKMEDE